MIINAGDVLTGKRRLRIETIDSVNRTVLVTDLSTKKTQTLTFELIQSLDSFLHFSVDKPEIEKNKEE